MPSLTSVSIQFGCLASTILVMSHPPFLQYLVHPLQRRKDAVPPLPLSPLDHQPPAPHTPTRPSLNPPAVSLHPHPNTPTPTANTILPSTGHLLFTSTSRPAFGLLIAPSFPFRSGTCAWA